MNLRGNTGLEEKRQNDGHYETPLDYDRNVASVTGKFESDYRTTRSNKIAIGFLKRDSDPPDRGLTPSRPRHQPDDSADDGDDDQHADPDARLEDVARDLAAAEKQQAEQGSYQGQACIDEYSCKRPSVIGSAVWRDRCGSNIPAPSITSLRAATTARPCSAMTAIGKGI
jgi:hypothetical protein